MDTLFRKKQKTKIRRHTRSHFQWFGIHYKRFKFVHIDIIGTSTPSNDFTYCPTLIGRSPGSFFHGSDFPLWFADIKGRQLESALYKALLAFLGSEKLRTTAYHPQANGKVERWHRTLKTAIKAHGNERWTEIVPTAPRPLMCYLRRRQYFLCINSNNNLVNFWTYLPMFP